MKKILFLIVLTVSGVLSANAQSYEPTAENMQARREFQDAKFGIFIHWGIYSMLGSGEWIQHTRKIDRDEYERLARGFYPALFNADEWVKAFKAAGARYVTITSRHHDGFSMFKTDATNYDIVDATPFHRDPIKELAEACQREGIKLNFYYSHMDWHRLDYPIGSASEAVAHDKSTTNWPQYYNFMNQQLTELLTQYGPIGAIWFDGEWDHKTDFNWQLPGQYALIHKLQPACLIANNHHHAVAPGEDIQVFEQDLPGQNTAGFSEGQEVSHQDPLETCITMSEMWGYNANDKNFKSTDNLIRKLVRAAGMNANLLLNIGPRPDGTLPEEAVERLHAMGKWMECYGETVYGTRGGLIPPQSWGVSTQRDKILYLHILDENTKELTLPIPTKQIRRAVCYDDQSPVAVTKGKTETTLRISDSQKRSVDTIIEVELK